MSEAFLRTYFARAYRENRLAHAYLLWGPETEKRDETARLLAQSLLCREGPQEHGGPCGACSVCRSIALGTYPGFVALPAESTYLEIDQVRELAEKLSIAFEGLRVVFIPQVERLTVPAANAFLKILEEPAGITTYIMTTGRPSNLLPTILSRCHRLPLFVGSAGPKPPEAPEILEVLADPQELQAADLTGLCSALPGKDKREHMAALIELILHQIRKSFPAGKTEKEGPSVFEGADSVALLTACEEVLQAAEDLKGNVNPELVAEELVYILLRLHRKRSGAQRT